jgi:hypothetical protein
VAQKTATAELDHVPPRLARFAWVAAAYQGKRWQAFQGWVADELGVRVPMAEVTRHVNAVRTRTNRGRKAKSPRAAPPSENLIEDWVRVDEGALGLLKLLFRIPGDFHRREQMHQALNTLVGIRSFMEIGSDLELLAVGLVRNMDEADDLRREIQRVVPQHTVQMDIISAESHAPTRSTWIQIARRELEEVVAAP